jgi:hypothetical protein
VFDYLSGAPQVKLVLKRNRFVVESSSEDVLNVLLADDVIHGAYVPPAEGGATFYVSKVLHLP